ncbi:hypothetical protein HJG60_020706 [Phyllostomus discolor]|uniref:Zinc finger protein 211-like n=1 Tax=Phyllostomus discolor TaxID=89673 RepID=A0A833YTD0_9CHIR|nr:hypothetical protein HJG60_020706 [Phyllostomus discolor]
MGTAVPGAPFSPAVSASLRTQSPPAVALLNLRAEIVITFEDVAVYFSRTEWHLLSEAQRRLYLDVMLENFALISSLGCCCGPEDVEAPTEQSISVRISKYKKPKSVLATQNSHPCESCGPVLRDIFLLVDNQETQHSSTLLRCGRCAKPFYFNAQGHQHQEQWDTTKNCILSNVDRVSLTESHNFHMSWKPCTSTQVGKSFLISSGHLRQMATHTMHRANKISKSGMTFQSRKHYSQRECKKAIGHDHTLVENHRSLTGRHCFLCCECGESFTHSSALHNHQRVHNGGRPYECSECGKSFTSSSDICEHHRVHTGEGPYEFGQHGVSFASRSDLHKHHRIDAGERPYECTECGKSFTCSSALRYHQRIHTGERPYDCGECGKSFNSIWALQRHHRVHTGERPYECVNVGNLIPEALPSINIRIHT